MLDRGDGTIVNIPSAVAIPDPPAPAGQGGWGMGYAMSKGAFHRMAGVLAHELGTRGNRAFNVEPGYVLTARMAGNQAELGFEGVYRGAPPPGPAPGPTRPVTAPAHEANAQKGRTVTGRCWGVGRGRQPDWRTSPAG